MKSFSNKRYAIEFVLALLLFPFLAKTNAQGISFSKDSVIFILNSQPEQLICADFNGDQNLDVAAVVQDESNGDPLLIFLNNGNGVINNQADSAYQNINYPRGFASGDFNNDQIKDLAVSIYEDSCIAIYFGNGDGRFTAGAVLDIPTKPGPLGCADFNNDGNADLVVGSSYGFLIVYTGDGQGGFSEQESKHSIGTVKDIKTFDMNGDQYTDIIVGTSNRAVVELFLNDGSGGFPSQNNFVTPYPSGFIGIADFNNDGYPDIVSGSGSNTEDNVTLLLRKSELEYPCVDTVSMGKYIRDITTGDFNNDQTMDIAVSDQNGLYIISGDGNGRLTSIDTVDIIDRDYYGGNDIKAADVDNNGFLDLVVTRYTQISIYYNTSATAITSGTMPPADFLLFQNYPNPFNPSTTISYQISQAGLVQLSIYNLLGQKVRELVDATQSPGLYRVNIDATGLAAGLYFYRLRCKQGCSTRKMVIIK